MFSRETIIALRARRTAQRIARDIMLPHLDLPPEARPPEPFPKLNPLGPLAASEHEAEEFGIEFWVLLVALASVAVIVAAIWKGIR